MKDNSKTPIEMQVESIYKAREANKKQFMQEIELKLQKAEAEALQIFENFLAALDLKDLLKDSGIQYRNVPKKNFDGQIHRMYSNIEFFVIDSESKEETYLTFNFYTKDECYLEGRKLDLSLQEDKEDFLILLYEGLILYPSAVPESK